LRMVFHLIEHAGGLDISSSHPELKQLTDQACDIIAWSEVRVCVQQYIY
jgi:hypothetical protein